jgi:hypothetical protein
MTLDAGALGDHAEGGSCRAGAAVQFDLAFDDAAPGESTPDRRRK